MIGCVDAREARYGTEFPDIGVVNLVIAREVRVVADSHVTEYAMRLHMRIRAKRFFITFSYGRSLRNLLAQYLANQFCPLQKIFQFVKAYPHRMLFLFLQWPLEMTFLKAFAVYPITVTVPFEYFEPVYTDRSRHLWLNRFRMAVVRQ